MKDWRKRRERKPAADNPRATSPRPAPPSPRLALSEGRLRIWGLHAVEAALSNPRRKIHRLLLAEGAGTRIANSAGSRGLKPMMVDARDLSRVLGADTVHQGLLAEVEPLPEPLLADLIKRAASNGPIVVLDQVTDPHNVGAILRSAAVFGASGLVMTRHHSPPLDGALAKAASGALETVPVTLVANLARVMDDMADHFVRRIGFDGAGEATLEETRFDGAVALVLGSEGKGLRRLTREHCDTVCRIGSAGSFASLNVSNAAAVALYAASRGKMIAAKKP